MSRPPAYEIPLFSVWLASTTSIGKSQRSQAVHRVGRVLEFVGKQPTAEELEFAIAKVQREAPTRFSPRRAWNLYAQFVNDSEEDTSKHLPVFLNRLRPAALDPILQREADIIARFALLTKATIGELYLLHGNEVEIYTRDHWRVFKISFCDGIRECLLGIDLAGLLPDNIDRMLCQRLIRSITQTPLLAIFAEDKDSAKKDFSIRKLAWLMRQVDCDLRPQSKKVSGKLSVNVPDDFPNGFFSHSKKMPVIPVPKEESILAEKVGFLPDLDLRDVRLHEELPKKPLRTSSAKKWPRLRLV